MKTLSIIVPVFNEETCINPFFERLKTVIDQINDFQFSVVFLNNFSTDGTLNEIINIANRDNRVTYITLSRNVGYQRSLLCGLTLCNSDLYFLIDVDCEDPPELLFKFIHEYNQGFDLVYGVRSQRLENKRITFARNVFYNIVKVVSDDETICQMAEFSLFTHEVKTSAIAERNSFPYIRGSLARVGFQRIGIPYCRQRRISGTSSYRPLGMIVFGVASILSSTTLPLRLTIFAMPLIVLLLLLGFGLFILDSSSTYVLILAFTAALLLILWATTFSALYIARGYKNTLNRPAYAIIRRFSSLCYH